MSLFEQTLNEPILKPSHLASCFENHGLPLPSDLVGECGLISAHVLVSLNEEWSC